MNISLALSEKLNRAWERKRRQERKEEEQAKQIVPEKQENLLIKEAVSVQDYIYLRWEKSDKTWAKLDPKKYQTPRPFGFFQDYEQMQRDADLVIAILPGFELDVIKNNKGYKGKMSLDWLNSSLPAPIDNFVN